jgi:hypothetical protein
MKQARSRSRVTWNFFKKIFDVLIFYIKKIKKQFMCIYDIYGINNKV